jgi:hypothetical protein
MISSAIILSFFSLFTLALCLPIPSRENLLHIRQAATSLVNSSDAWTTVIANIGPLVVLVGEKSFKSYIKNCKSWIQYGLYCCAPMGGLSAVISVLRLVGGSLVKTIIGRQHEGSAEVYLDVTSASTGLVGQQFIHGHVSPIVAPDPQREAWFIFRGSTVSQPPSIDSDPKTSQNRRSNAEHYRIAWNSARTISRLFENCKKPALATFAVAVYPTLATQDDNAIFCGGKEDHRMFRNLFRKLYPKAGQSIPLPNESLGIAATCICPIRKYGDPWNGKDEQDELIEKRILKPTNAIAFGFEVCCKGVSAALTISEPRYPKLFVFITLIAEVLMYSAFPLTVSFGNRDIALADVLFAIVGHAVVVLGMMVLVWTIKYATVEYGIAVPPITRAAGFVSKDEPKASHVYTSLRTIYISKMRNDWSWKAQWKFIGESSALVVTGGFISMYLGLRQLKWWTVSCFEPKCTHSRLIIARS